MRSLARKAPTSSWKSAGGTLGAEGGLLSGLKKERDVGATPRSDLHVEHNLEDGESCELPFHDSTIWRGSPTHQENNSSALPQSEKRLS